MKYFFIHRDKDTGKRGINDVYNFIDKKEELNECVNKGIMDQYLKIPAFKNGDKVKLISPEETSLDFLKAYNGKEMTVVSMERTGKLNFTEPTKNFIYIIDLQPI